MWRGRGREREKGYMDGESKLSQRPGDGDDRVCLWSVGERERVGCVGVGWLGRRSGQKVIRGRPWTSFKPSKVLTVFVKEKALNNFKQGNM